MLSYIIAHVQPHAPCTTLSCQPARQSSAPRPSTSSRLMNASCAHANRTPPLLPLLSSLPPLLLPPLLMAGPNDGCAAAARSPTVPRLLHPWPLPLSSTTALRMPLGQVGTTYTYLQAHDTSLFVSQQQPQAQPSPAQQQFSDPGILAVPAGQPRSRYPHIACRSPTQIPASHQSCSHWHPQTLLTCARPHQAALPVAC